MTKTKKLVTILSTLLIINGCSIYKPTLEYTNITKKYELGFGYKGTKLAAAYLFLAEQIQEEQKQTNNKLTKIPVLNLDLFKIKLENASFKPLNLLRADFDYNTTINTREAKDYYLSLL